GQTHRLRVRERAYAYSVPVRRNGIRRRKTVFRPRPLARLEKDIGRIPAVGGAWRGGFRRLSRNQTPQGGRRRFNRKFGRTRRRALLGGFFRRGESGRRKGCRSRREARGNVC